MEFLVVFFLGVEASCFNVAIVGGLAASSAGSKCRAVGGNTDRVETVRARNSGGIRNAGGRASATVA